MIKKAYNWASSWKGTFIIVFVIIFFIAQAFIIPSGSMKNTLLVGDMLFVKKFSYGIPIPRIPWLEIPILPDFNGNGHLIEGDKPKRGDIVVFRYPNNDKVHFVKRLVATGGDEVLIQNKNLILHPKEGNEYVKKHYPKSQIVEVEGKLWVINPYEKDHLGIHHDPKLINDGSQPELLFNMLPIKIPKGEYFMMGDNRDHSDDSRFWGMVKYKYIVGKPWFIYLSFDKNKKIRWNRVFRTPESLEKDLRGKKVDINHKEGIY